MKKISLVLALLMTITFITWAETSVGIAEFIGSEPSENEGLTDLYAAKLDRSGTVKLLGNLLEPLEDSSEALAAAGLSSGVQYAIGGEIKELGGTRILYIEIVDTTDATVVGGSETPFTDFAEIVLAMEGIVAEDAAFFSDNTSLETNSAPASTHQMTEEVFWRAESKDGTLYTMTKERYDQEDMRGARAMFTTGKILGYAGAYSLAFGLLGTVLFGVFTADWMDHAYMDPTSPDYDPGKYSTLRTWLWVSVGVLATGVSLIATSAILDSSGRKKAINILESEKGELAFTPVLVPNSSVGIGPGIEVSYQF